MKFVFDERTASEAAAYLLSRRGRSMGYLKLLKLLYLADRRSLIETGFPITGDSYAAMDKGPVLSALLDRFRGRVFGAASFRSLIQRGNQFGVRLLADPPERGALSDYEIGVLADIDQQYGHMTGEELIDLLHRDAPEWTPPKPGSSRPIAPETILRLGGRSEGEIAAIARDADYFYAVERRNLGRALDGGCETA